ncbi:hypothetical protein PQY67_05060 [Pseudomonadales bacterium]|nr:hypothetical protein [Pseudomonadales bacterium]
MSGIGEMVSFNMQRVVGFMVAVLFILMFVIPQAYFWMKLPFLGVALLYTLVNLSSGRFKIYSSTPLRYYILIAILTVIWLLIGAINGNHQKALYDGFRLYVSYNAIFFLLIVFLTNTNFYRNVLPIAMLGALFIGVLAIYTVIDVVLNLNSIPESIRSTMYMQVGLHSGHTRINNVNIGMYTFLLPFLLSYCILDERKKPKLIYLVLVISVVGVVLASRRIVVYLMVMVPFFCISFDIFITSALRSRLLFRVIKIYVYLLFLSMFIAAIANYFSLFDIEGFAGRIFEVLIKDEESPRQTQLAALLQGFYNAPLFGTGFGGIASVVRSEFGWNYELLYPKLLFHSGLVGTISLFSVIGYYTIKVTKSCGRDKTNYSINVALIIGFISMLIASATNPYLNSFDFLFGLGVPPLVAELLKRERLMPFASSSQS